jgi:hypothetical protein
MHNSLFNNNMSLILGVLPSHVTTSLNKKKIYIYIYCFCFVDRASRYNCVKEKQLDAQFIRLYFANLYMFQAYLGPSSGGTTIHIERYRRLSVVLFGSNPTRTTGSHLKRIISTNFCTRTVVPPDDGPRYARNM